MYYTKYKKYKAKYTSLKNKIQRGGGCSENKEKCDQINRYYNDEKNQCCTNAECTADCHYVSESIELPKELTTCKTGNSINIQEYLFMARDTGTESNFEKVRDPNYEREIYFPKMIDAKSQDKNIIFEKGNILGTGGNGIAVKYTSQTGNINIAVKCSFARKGLDRDISIIKAINEEPKPLNICRKFMINSSYFSMTINFKDAQGKPTNKVKYDYIVMEEADGTLADILPYSQKSQKLRYAIIRQLSFMLKCLLDNNYYYLDLKPDNIFYKCVNNTNIKLILGDLGSAETRMTATTTTYAPINRVLSNSNWQPDWTITANENDIVWGIGIIYLFLNGIFKSTEEMKAITDSKFQNKFSPNWYKNQFKDFWKYASTFHNVNEKANDIRNPLLRQKAKNEILNKYNNLIYNDIIKNPIRYSITKTMTNNDINKIIKNQIPIHNNKMVKEAKQLYNEYKLNNYINEAIMNSYLNMRYPELENKLNETREKIKQSIQEIQAQDTERELFIKTLGTEFYLLDINENERPKLEEIIKEMDSRIVKLEPATVEQPPS